MTGVDVSLSFRHVLAFSMFGLGTVLGDAAVLKRAKAISTDYSFKMRLHFRVHGWEIEQKQVAVTSSE